MVQQLREIEKILLGSRVYDGVELHRRQIRQAHGFGSIGRTRGGRRYTSSTPDYCLAVLSGFGDNGGRSSKKIAPEGNGHGIFFLVTRKISLLFTEL